MNPPLKSILVVINIKWARILNRIHRRTQKALNLLKIWPTDLDTFLDCQTIFIRFSVQWESLAIIWTRFNVVLTSLDEFESELIFVLLDK